MQNWFQSKWGCRKVEIALERGPRWKIWLVQIKIHSILIRPATLSRRGPSRSWETAGTYFFGFFRNLHSKFTNIKSKLKFLPQTPNFRNQYRHLRSPETTQKCQILNGHDPNINSSHSVWFWKKSQFLCNISPFWTLCPPSYCKQPQCLIHNDPNQLMIKIVWPSRYFILVIKKIEMHNIFEVQIFWEVPPKIEKFSSIDAAR